MKNRCKMIVITDDVQYVRRKDTVVRIRSFAGVLVCNGELQEILPETSEKNLAVLFYKKRVQEIHVISHEQKERGACFSKETRFNGDMFLMWLEENAVTLNFLVAHSPENGQVRSVFCQMDVLNTSDAVKCVRTLLQLGEDTLETKIPSFSAGALLESYSLSEEKKDKLIEKRENVSI